MEDKMKKLLPIGTVVRVFGDPKRVMIFGRLQKDKNEVFYDYAGCLFPEGGISNRLTFLFNNKDIDEICHMGFVNEEEEKYQKVLEEYR